jgi:DNA-binding NarL/FixJ family response regulator
MNSPAMQVLLVEDHAIVRETLQDFVERLPQVSGCSAVASAEAALQFLKGHSPDLLVIDLSLPGMSGIEFLRTIRRILPALRCLILSGHSSRNYVRQAMEAGANGYMLKGDPLEIERGIRAAYRGERYVSQGLEEVRH